MTPEALLALMFTLECHSLVVNIPERRETVVKTVCVKVVSPWTEPRDTETARAQTTKVAAVVPAKTKTVTKKTTKRPIKKKSRKKYRKRA